MLASTIEALCQANLGEVETMAQVQQTLQRAASVTNDLEARVGATEVSQEQAKSIAERMQWMSEQAIQEASDYRRIASEGRGNGPKSARTKFADLVTSIADGDRTRKIGSASDTANTV